MVKETMKITKDFQRDFSQYQKYIKTIYGIDIFYIQKDGSANKPAGMKALKKLASVRLDMEDINKVVMTRMHDDCPGLRKYDSLSHSHRGRDYIMYKKIFCMFARQAGYTVTGIGAFLNKDHSTVIHNLKTGDNHLKAKDPFFTDRYNRIKQLVTHVENISENNIA